MGGRRDEVAVATGTAGVDALVGISVALGTKLAPTCVAIAVVAGLDVADAVVVELAAAVALGAGAARLLRSATATDRLPSTKTTEIRA